MVGYFCAPHTYFNEPIDDSPNREIQPRTKSLRRFSFNLIALVRCKDSQTRG